MIHVLKDVAIVTGLVVAFLIVYVTVLWLVAEALDWAVHEDTGHCACRKCEPRRDHRPNA